MTLIAIHIAISKIKADFQEKNYRKLIRTDKRQGTLGRGRTISKIICDDVQRLFKRKKKKLPPGTRKKVHLRINITDTVKIGIVVEVVCPRNS